MSGMVSGQLMLFLRSIALGGALGLVYDLLRALRKLGGGVWGAMLDGLYCLLTACALFFFVLAGEGELRIFVLLGALGGAVLFFCLLSQLLRPLWDFWLDILLSPLRLAAELLKKTGGYGKKLFSFACGWGKMVLMGRRRGPAAPEKGDEAMKKTPEKGKIKRPSSKLTALILLILLAGVCVQILNLFGQLRTAREEEALYAARLAELQAVNMRLQEDIANRDSLDLIEEIARDELGLVTPGEKVFVFSK